MNFHEIRTDDMLNGEGLRVVLFVAGCNHFCEGCHNPETWDCHGGKPFNYFDKVELLNALNKDYIDGLTLSGGDPLYPANRGCILELLLDIKKLLPDKTVWLYTGFDFEDLMLSIDVTIKQILPLIDVIVDGEFKQELADVNYPFAGSTNQRVIDVKASLKENKVVLKKY